MSLITKIYQEGRSMYGSPRIHERLNQLGINCSRKRVAKLMKKEGLAAKMRKSWKKTPNLFKKYEVIMTQQDEWKVRIEEYKKSGMSLIAFGKANGLKYSMLKYWFYRFRDLEQKQNIKASNFKELPRSSSGLK